MKTMIPVNPETLRWARQSINMPVEEVALRMKKEVEIIEEWEDGVSSPTYVQLEKLAYEVYKRPVAVFFFPEPPKEVGPRTSFRTLPESEIKQLSPRFLQLFRRAQAMQANLEELNEGLNPAVRRIFRDLHLRPTDEATSMARKVRAYLGVDLQSQIGWKDVDAALKQWRAAVESNGIFVFKDAFKQDDISGFCLYDDEFPVIYINNSMPFGRQIFTLFHELAHLLFRTGGIDTNDTAFLRSMRGDNKRIEMLCNRFVGAFLVPGDDFEQQVRATAVDNEVVGQLAARYKVSWEVILRKCLDKRLIDQRQYEAGRKEAKEKAVKARARSGKGNYYRNQIAYLGAGYLGLVLSQYYQNRFSAQQVAKYLNVKANHVADLEAMYLGRETGE
ncbi:MAG: ImmA/IrrE family metallo-endopeptidase [Sedimentisphaerales bacterium]|nr:ImmA/IrrE family metallo-endopeptidase [Sedimentisphaerales bacterium]